MTDKEMLYAIEYRLRREGAQRQAPDDHDANWLRAYIARTWPEKKSLKNCSTCGREIGHSGCKLTWSECDPAYSGWVPKLSSPTALPPGYRLETNGEWYRVVTPGESVLASSTSKDAAIESAYRDAAEEAKWKDVEA